MTPAGGSLRAGDLEAVTRPIDEATNLPSALYVDPEVWRIEQEEIFGRMWLCVGRHEDIPEPGDFLTSGIGGESALVVRGRDAEARAFHNVCRHRGACLVGEDGGSSRAFRCRYHGWTYDRRGRLKAAPWMQERPGFDPGDWPLTPVRLDDWGGFLFLCFDDEAPSLAESMADFPDLSRYRLPELRRGHRIAYEVDANWKIVCENYSECYHCALVHPQLNRVSHYRSGGDSETGSSYNGGPMELNEGMSTLSMSGRRELPAIRGLEGEDRRLVHYYNLYPQFLIGLAPDYVIVHRVWPRSPERSTVVCEWLFPPPATERPGADGVVEFWDVTNRQDWELCEMVQRTAASGGARPGPYHPLEACVHAFDRWVVERLHDRLLELLE